MIWAVWYRFTTPADGRLGMSADPPMAEALFAGTSLDSLTLISCGQGTVAQVAGATTYYVQVGSVDASRDAPFRFSVSFTPAPENDDRAAALSTGDAPTSVTGNSRGATIEATDPAVCSQYDQQPATDGGVWYRYSAPLDGTLVIDFDGHWQGTAVFEGASLERIACMGSSQNYSSYRVTAPVRAGETYWIEIFNFPLLSGEFTMTLALVPGVAIPAD